MDIANKHKTLLDARSHGYFDCDHRYALQKVKDNLLFDATRKLIVINNGYLRPPEFVKMEAEDLAPEES
ncbi:MAG: hypothetical protein SWO11_09560 [Thermodesulfobacteriota bacterium]|nr:hypothetical protein [Thermodesulfobacteriota bacterium]